MADHLLGIMWMLVWWIRLTTLFVGSTTGSGGSTESGDIVPGLSSVGQWLALILLGDAAFSLGRIGRGCHYLLQPPSVPPVIFVSCFYFWSFVEAAGFLLEFLSGCCWVAVSGVVFFFLLFAVVPRRCLFLDKVCCWLFLSVVSWASFDLVSGWDRSLVFLQFSRPVTVFATLGRSMSA